ncbi:XRE family transcriptional regulator [Mycobacterium sp. 050128]|uniref:helix-turn-helix domain-containing protein n=1 Tax=Mycobacterium sp. 050128 TaxID=3096112 RepID=UPI002ED7AE45
MVDVDSIAVVVGRRVRDARNVRRWTLDELASRSGVSRRMIINIEQGAMNPSIATLLRISNALGIGLPALVETDAAPPSQVVRAGEGVQLWKGKGGGTGVLTVGTRLPDVLELWDWSLGPGDVHASEPHAVGTREELVVISGKIDVRVGDTTTELRAGDAISFRGDVAHSYGCAAGARIPARFILSVFEPDLEPDARRRP